MKKFTFLSITRKGVSFLVLMLACTMAFAQNPYTITFQDETIEMPENISTFQWNQMPESAHLRDGYIGWIQFYETPTQAVQDLFAANGLDLISYIPHHTYIFRFPENTSVSFLQNNGVRSIVPMEGRFKLSQDLKNGNIGSWATDGENYIVTLQHYPYVDTQYVINDLAAQQISVKEQYAGSNNIDLVIPNDCLEELSNQPYVKWVEVIIAPSVPDSDEGRTIHRANLLDTQTPGGRNYTGEGVGTLCRDDGPVGPHIDFEGRHNGPLGQVANGQGHGDGVSGIMSGSGNLNPANRGMAAGADLYVVNYASSFLDTNTVNLINSGDVQVTNSSYSNGCNAGYTTVTQTVDTQINTIPTLLHVFSAGNSNGLNCGYGAGSQWGNITGGHKQGKNVIATANLFEDGVLVSSSSRGPAHDGRIKPDISAHGQGQVSTNQNNLYQSFGGTSAASPGIAGVSAQLYQVFMDANGGALPESALIKAALLNTTNDLGNIGPDFKFGWGLVNAYRAALLLEDGRYLSDNVSQGGNNTHTINVPANTTQVRFMVYWSDPAATPGASPALVNDLDLVVTDPSSGTHLPYVLDSTPNPVNLDTPATNGPDHLNNMEQVLLNNPAAGNYDIDITGFNVPVGPQNYYVVYEIITDNLVITYPNGGEALKNVGAPQIIHWDATNTAANFLLEYSLDNGSTWTNLGTAPSTASNYDWTPPNEVSGEVLIRISSGSYSDTSDAVFSLAGFVGGLNTIQVCETTATIGWTEFTGAEEYDLYMLGDKYMEVVGTTTNTEITVPILDGENEDFWYAVVARNDTEGWRTPRTVARLHDSGLLECNPLGLEDIILGSIVMSPNPASDQVTISLSDTNFSSFEVTITNSLGQTLQTVNERALNGTNEATLNVSSYRTGLYFVTIEIDGQSTTKKLVIK
jgi:hypothetical protein